MSNFKELKRRNVFRVAIAYLAGEREQGLMLIANAADGGFFHSAQRGLSTNNI
jgi:hypothetical protein